jgi:hypothetical protein
MLEESLGKLIPKPDVAFAQHVLAYPAGKVGTVAGPVLSAGDSIHSQELGPWQIRILDASNYNRPTTRTVEVGYVHGADGMKPGHGLSLLSERVGEGGWTLPLEIAWFSPPSDPLNFGAEQIEQFVKQHGWLPEQVLAVDGQYTVAPFLTPVHECGVPILPARAKQPLLLSAAQIEAPTPRQAQAIYDERFSIEHSIRFLKGELGATCGQFNGQAAEGRVQVWVELVATAFWLLWVLRDLAQSNTEKLPGWWRSGNLTPGAVNSTGVPGSVDVCPFHCWYLRTFESQVADALFGSRRRGVFKEFASLVLERQQPGARTAQVGAHAPIRTFFAFERHIMPTAAGTVGGVAQPDTVRRKIRRPVYANQMKPVVQRKVRRNVNIALGLRRLNFFQALLLVDAMRGERDERGKALIIGLVQAQQHGRFERRTDHTALVTCAEAYFVTAVLQSGTENGADIAAPQFLLRQFFEQGDQIMCLEFHGQISPRFSSQSARSRCLPTRAPV